jgi:hypothetical protein
MLLEEQIYIKINYMILIVILLVIGMMITETFSVHSIKILGELRGKLTSS